MRVAKGEFQLRSLGCILNVFEFPLFQNQVCPLIYAQPPCFYSFSFIPLPSTDGPHHPFKGGGISVPRNGVSSQDTGYQIQLMLTRSDFDILNLSQILSQISPSFPGAERGYVWFVDHLVNIKTLLKLVKIRLFPELH